MKFIRLFLTGTERQTNAAYNKIFRLLPSTETSLCEFDVEEENMYVVELNIQPDNVVGQMNKIPLVSAEVIEFPEEVQAIIDTFVDETYTECTRIENELKPLGWTFNWYLDAIPYYIRKIK